MSIGSKIKQFRKAADLTQAELAAKANMSRSYVADVERDRYNPSVDTLTTIANALGIDVAQFFDSNPTLPPSSIDNLETPNWANSKDKRDFKKMLEEDSGLMFDGIPLDEEDRQRALDVLTGLFWDAKKRSKEKYTNKRYKDNDDN